MRRISLSAKLFIAVLPLLAAIGVLLTSSIRSDFDEVAQARRGAQLGSTWELLIVSIRSVESEQGISAADDQAAIADARRATDSAMNAVRGSVRDIGDSDAMVLLFDSASSAVSNARVGVEAGDQIQVSPSGVGTTTGARLAVQEFDTSQRDLIDLGRLLSDEAVDVDLGRSLYAVGTLAAAEQIANDLVQAISDWPESRYLSSVAQAADLGDGVVASVSEFRNVAPPEWQEGFSDGRWVRVLSDTANDLDDIVSEADRGNFVALDPTRFSETISDIATIRDEFAKDIVSDANSEADRLQRTTILQIGVTLAAVLLAALMAFLLTRSITRRVRAVVDKAREVADIQLPALVSALADPRGRTVIPQVAPIENAGSDELGELAGAFNTVQTTLVDVAHQQVEVLRRGVSNIFVTMARRTRSLIDRQLALLDELEAEVDDPKVLANYYQLDHLATRMRRNSESLLVLANAESRRRRTKATDVDDVVRAAIGEVDDYRRIDVLNLDHLQVRGAVVADISHLLAELLDNASSFSPPESRVTVSGRYADENYLISISDEGVGISAGRLEELNDILAHPPIVGLSVEPTLGMSVVSLLAHKHGVQVHLLPSSPGLMVEVMLPASIHEVVAATRVLGVQPTSNGDDRLAEAFADPTREPKQTDTFVPHVVTVEPGIVTEPTYEPEPAAATEPTYEPEPAAATEPTYEPEPAWQAEPTTESPASDATPVDPAFDDAWSAVSDPPIESDPAADLVPEESGREPAAEVDPFSLTPPRAHDRLSGEFDRLPAPPAFGTEPTSRPFSDPAALPIPARRTESERQAANGPANLSLPSRSRGPGPDGPDRLAPLHVPSGDSVPVIPTNPSSLRSALTAFEAGRAGARPELAPLTPALPTRDPGRAFDHEEVTRSTTQSRLDPEAIRERLRSFRKEFQLGRDGEGAAGPDGDQNDLGGDR